MVIDFDLEEIILYLNATEPTGKYCKNIENLKNKLLKAEKLEIENKFIKDALNTLIKIDDSDLSHLKIKAIPQNVAANQDVIKLLKEMLEND